MQQTLSAVLDDTITARWRRRLVGVKPGEKRHWRTKVAYYIAVIELLATRIDDDLSWRAIVDVVRPRGNRSTFYEVTGQNAKHALLGDLLTRQSLDAMQLVLCYRRASAVQQLIDEAKVWSYWPYRERLLAQYRVTPPADRSVAADRLTTIVTAWGRRNPALAAAIGYAPPLCAVEDLLLVRPGQLSAFNAAAMLTDAVKDALTAPQRPDPATDPSAATAQTPSTPDEEALLADLAVQIDALERISQGIRSSEAVWLRHRAADLLIDAAMTLR